ncbi:DUF192 domain-containing protein, partial [Candidatus Woesebacteria bacterium]|nr:DUF192 domain-containing protein [Candidatus Woesebacteria bacterium]
ITVLVYLYLFPRSRPNKNGIPLWEGYEVIEKEVEGKKLKLVVAETSSQWQQGLMHVRKPVPFDGMIFTSTHAVPQVFWNMNTFEDLEVYWLRDGKIIGESFLPSIEKKGMTTVASPGRADTVIEVIR